MSSDVALTTALTILIIVDISGNCLVCWVVKRNRDMRYVVSVIEYSAVCPLVIGLISSSGSSEQLQAVRQRASGTRSRNAQLRFQLDTSVEACAVRSYFHMGNHEAEMSMHGSSCF